jgi:TolB protein
MRLFNIMKWFVGHALVLIFLILSLGLFGCSPTLTPDEIVTTESPLPTPSLPSSTFTSPVLPKEREILFHSNRNGDFDLYLMKADGSDTEALTSASGNDVEPQWAPDGQSIVFSSDRDGDYEVYTLSLATEQAQRLTENPATDWGATWSSDANRIVFTSDREGPTQLYIMDRDGADQKLLDTGGSGWAPSWSPTRDEIVFVSDRGGVKNIYRFELESGVVEQITFCEVQCERPAWSADGDQIVYMGAKESTSLFDPDEIYIIPRGGGETRQLTDDLTGDITPSWSPTGNWIAFSSSRAGGWNIFVINASGGDPVQLTSGEVWNRSPVWRP